MSIPRQSLLRFCLPKAVTILYSENKIIIIDIHRVNLFYYSSCRRFGLLDLSDHFHML
jgi:hypothetical protein